MPPKSARRTARSWGPLAGIAFVPLFIASVVVSSPPADSASGKDWIASYTGASNQFTHFATGILLVLAALSLTSFLSALWQRIADAQRPTSLSPVGLVAAGVAGAGIAAGGVVMAVISGGEVMGSYPLPSVDVLRLTNDLGFALVSVAGMLAASLSVVCLSVQGRAAGVFGRTTFIFGIVTAVLLLAALAFLPIIFLLVWVLVVSIGWIREPRRAAVVD